MTETSDFARYLEKVEDVFLKLRGTPFVLSPSDVQLVLEWHREGVPLGLVEDVLQDGMERYRAKKPGGKPGSLSYFRWSVMECHLKHVESQRDHGNSKPLTGREAFQKMLQVWMEFYEQLPEHSPIRECVRVFVDRVGEILQSGKSSRVIGASLLPARDRFFHCVVQALSEREAEELNLKVQARVAEYLGDAPPHLKETLTVSVTREEIRRRYQLPPLFV